ncbi:hypothetical protein DLJ57_10590, partial [Micromonospora chalcea]
MPATGQRQGLAAVAVRTRHAEDHGGEPALPVCLGGLQQRVVEQLQQPPGLALDPVQRLQALAQLAGEDGRLHALARHVTEKEDRPAVGELVRTVEVAADAHSGLRGPVRGAPLHAGRGSRLDRQQAGLQRVGDLGLVAVEQSGGQRRAGPCRERADQVHIGLVVPAVGAAGHQQRAGRWY